MSDKSTGRTHSNGRDPAAGPPVRPEQIRNVVLVGHSGAGKTSLAESLALAAGAVNRAGRVHDGSTVSDHDEIEHRQQRSIQLALLPLDHAGTRINLLDTPGYADYVGELRAGLRAADAALFVVSATEETIDGPTRDLWQECAALSLPRALVVTRLDAPQARFAATVERCREAFGGGDPDRVLPLHLPRPDGTLRDLLDADPTPDATGPDATGPDAEAARDRLVGAIAAESEDETLLDRYLSGATPDPRTLLQGLARAIARSAFHPVLATAAATDHHRDPLGARELLDLVAHAFPAPTDRPAPAVTAPDGSPRPALACDPEGPLAAEVVKTSSDPYVGRISLVRVFSGTLRPDLPVHVSGHGQQDRGHQDHDLDERVGAVGSPLGRTLRPAAQGIAGDIVSVARLTRAETGDTLSAPDDPLLVAPWELPDPLLPIAITAHSKADEDKLSQGLARLVAEDPTLRLEQNPDTRQLVLWCLGEAHADVLLDRLRSRYGVTVEPVPYTVPLRETFAAAGHGRGRHVKQSGGHGQFAICELDVEPLPAGSGFEFVDRIVGGAVPRQFVPSVEKGVRAQLARGVAAGFPLVDVRVSLVDGKAHSVDSSDAAFQTAAGLALREAAAATAVRLLEPVALVSVLVPDEYVGGVLGDLSGRRGRVLGTEPVAETGRTVVRAEVPEWEIVRYAVDLRSLSHGTGTFTRRYARHEPMPEAVAARVSADAAVS
ncbi:elongation factor G-like protein EF-G2 [Streptacidiphilus sp. P02-A3a]|uniref:elongation factor G-like protein EF-G2 n=1 Tax=Streptacidiphilus sp. P02-A3a TaxID=2704468 RepID=UPI0015F87C42|nr:elongation factor G-like protein EF-G2 [Streptacidiphilus sp. P02-A3a]QMU69197.1 elongation factor G-like protein EF-G2 [Streptacidiphilus sp. P02-A3a]